MTIWKEFHKNIHFETFEATELEYKEEMSLHDFITEGFETFLVTITLSDHAKLPTSLVKSCTI